MNQSKKEKILYLVLGFLVAIIALPVGVAVGTKVFSEPVTVLNSFLEVIRENGLAIGTRKPEDTEFRWKVIAGTTRQQFGDGQSILTNLEFLKVGDGRTLMGLTSNPGVPMGITLNDRRTASMSLSVQNGQLVIRDERQGLDHITAIIDDNGISFPQRGGTTFP